ncbi:thioredoxin Y, chloroplastic-like, partial [Phalaenopsis equestris]|uniref:thioredoxin Y, chloroplastic-like n=1 Tax=Phalaenopsis equestris TaxID=78828 RepID=UPI0009E27E9D
QSVAAEFSRLAAVTSIRASPIPRFPAISRQISLIPQRRITPKVQAKKQTFSSFDDLLENSDKPVLVDFYATWCGPCQFMVPILDQVSEKLKDKIKVVKIDTEKYTTIANRYKIEALPTFILFRDGQPCDRFEGALPAELNSLSAG